MLTSTIRGVTDFLSKTTLLGNLFSTASDVPDWPCVRKAK